MTYSLYSVGVEKNALFVTELADLGDRLDRADLVVSIHYSNKSGFVGDSLGYLFGSNNTVFAYGEVGNGEAVLFEVSAGMKNSVMLESGGDDVVLVLCGKAFRSCADSPVVTFCSAACEEYLARVAAESGSSFFTSLFNDFLCVTSELVDA